MSDKPKFIRKNGKVIPVGGKKKSGSSKKKAVGKKKSNKKAFSSLRKSNKKLSKATVDAKKFKPGTGLLQGIVSGAIGGATAGKGKLGGILGGLLGAAIGSQVKTGDKKKFESAKRRKRAASNKSGKIVRRLKNKGVSNSRIDRSQEF